MITHFDDFIGLYPIDKTLCFEARPIGKTLENLLKSDMLKQDEHRAESYVKVKKLIDSYHKDFIERALSQGLDSTGCHVAADKLAEYSVCYFSSNRDAKANEKLDSLSEELRQLVVKQLKQTEGFKNLFKKELIEVKGEEADLVKFVKSAPLEALQGMSRNEALAVISEFNGFTTYFGGFHENRQNIYTDKAQATAVAYRLIDENLPKFLDNVATYAKLAAVPDLKVQLEALSEAMKGLTGVAHVEQLFCVEHYDHLLTQCAIDTYNTVIGGRVDDSTPEHEHIQGINQYVNLYNQQHKEAKLPKMKTLYKQILSDRQSFSWLPESFECDLQVIDAVRSFNDDFTQHVLENSRLQNLLCTIGDYDTKGIYINNDRQLELISQRLCKHWNVIQEAILADMKNKDHATASKKETEAYEEQLKKAYKNTSCFSIYYIDECLKAYYESKKCDIDATTDNSASVSEDGLCMPPSIEAYFADLGATRISSEYADNLFVQIAQAQAEAASLLHATYSSSNPIMLEKESKEKIKNLLDAIKDLQSFVKPLIGGEKESYKDNRFVGELTVLWEVLDQLTPLYNMVRNYTTKKPYSRAKIKLNFANPTLFAGWDENKESDNATIILRRNGLYYLGIMDKGSKKLLNKTIPHEGECYEKMVYKLFKDASVMIPKCSTQKKDVKKHFAQSTDDYVLSGKEFLRPLTITKEIFDLNNVTYGGNKKYKKIQKGYLETMADPEGYDHAVKIWLQFCMDFLQSYKGTQCYDLSRVHVEEYADISSFYSYIDTLLYRITFKPVSVSFVQQWVDEGKMYLFQLYNKDFSAHSKGTPNMHTLYWKALFDPHNLADVVYKLNGQAEMFYRPKSIVCKKPTHPANQPIRQRRDTTKTSLFAYDLIKDKRFTVDKFLFHVPIRLNFKAKAYVNINNMVREYLKQAQATHVIGIDRGERHLLYLTVIDSHGNIVEQRSLNMIESFDAEHSMHTNYHALLDAREEQRQKARRDWETIDKIKDLKEGYLSQVVHILSQLIVKYHAIVVLEDLNFGFKRSRIKVEKQVYQSFERKLIDKLNYMVNKRQNATLPGGLLKAYQLAERFTSFKEMGKQSGFLFYVDAWNTSKIDPVTGFVNLLDTNYTNVKNARDFFDKFLSIRYNPTNDWFEFEFDYNRFHKKAEGTRTHWTLCTWGERIETFRNGEKNAQWENREVCLTTEFKQLFQKFGIDLHTDLKAAIVEQEEKKFFERLLHLLKLTLQMRNSITGTEMDYLVSPVANADGIFYDSRRSSTALPQNADANGAYNIARKGLMLISKIKQAEDVGKLKLAISKTEWLSFAQQKPYLHD